MGEKLKKEVIMNYCNPQGFKAELREIRKMGKDAFFSWFDGGETVDGAYEKSKDVFTRLMLPWAKKYLGKLNEKVSLDIGYGGGGQVFAASKHFKYSIGLDVHGEISSVEAELRKRQGGRNKNTALFIGEGKNIPMDKDKIDFVYSWVTFLHLGTIQVVEEYLKEMFRVMKEGGVAVLFFTRLIRSHQVQSMNQYVEDMKKENLHQTGFREGGPLTRVNRPNLIMSFWKMERLAKEHGFSVIGATHSENEEGKVCGQHGLVFMKPKKKKPTTFKKKNPITLKGKKENET